MSFFPDPTMADSLQDIWSFDCLESVHLAAVQALQASGVVVPTGEHVESALKQTGCFGVYIDFDYQQTLPYKYNDYTFQLPRVFVECVQFLEKHTEQEGLFRKAGSVSRQKALRSSLENGCSIPDDANVHDVACLFKQYLRVLPNPLLTRHLSTVFEACVTLLQDKDQIRCLLLACLLLPTAHLQCLSVLMNLLKKVCEKKDDSRMTANNLAIIMAPNLLTTQTDAPVFVASGNPLLVQTNIVQALIDNCNLIGRVPPEVGVASEAYKSELHLQTTRSSEDMTEEEKDLPGRYNKKKKKQRTASLSGLVLGLGSRLKQKGTSMFSADHVTSSSVIKKRMSVKRKGASHEDLLRRSNKLMNDSPTSSFEEIRRSIPNRSLGNSSRTKPRPFLSRQRPVVSLSSLKSKRTHVNISQPMLFEPILTPQVDISNPAPNHHPSGPKPNGVEPTQLEFSEGTSGNDPGSSEDNVREAANNKLSSRLGRSSFKRSASESDLFSEKDLPLVSPSTTKRIRIEKPVTFHSKSVKSFTSSHSEFALSSKKSQECTIKFAAPTPVSLQQSHGTKVLKLCTLDLTCADSLNSIGITTPPSRGVQFTFGMPTLVDPFKECATQSVPIDFNPQCPSICLEEDVTRKRSEVSRVQNEAIINSDDTKDPSLIDKPQNTQGLYKKVSLSPIHSQTDSLLLVPTHLRCLTSPGGSVSELDEAFLRTPYVGMDSPNLLDKINSEIAQRSDFSSVKPSPTWFSNFTPVVPAKLRRESLQHVNESYKKAVLGSNAYNTRFQNELKVPTNVDLSKKVPADVQEETNDVASEVKMSKEDSSIANESHNMSCPPVALQFHNLSTIEDDRQIVATVSPNSQQEQSSTTCTVSASEQLPILNDKNTLRATQAPSTSDGSCTLSSATQSNLEQAGSNKDDPSDCNYNVKETSNSNHTDIKKKDHNHFSGPMKFITSPARKNRHAVHSTKFPAVRQGTKLKATSNSPMKRRYAYSATLGIGDSLVHPRTRRGQKVMSPKIAPRYCSPASLSASLGITTLAGKGRRYASRSSQSRNHHPRSELKSESDYSPKEGSVVQNKHNPSDGMQSAQVESHWWKSYDHMDTLKQNGTISSDVTTDEQRLKDSMQSVIQADYASPSSPAPTLLKIVESNVAQIQKKQAAHFYDRGHSPSPTSPLKSLSDSQPQHQVNSHTSISREYHQRPMSNKDLHVGISVPESEGGKQSAKQTPLRKGLGLRSPWFWRSSTRGQQRAYNSVLLHGETSSRAELYVVKTAKSSPLDKLPVSIVSEQLEVSSKHITKGDLGKTQKCKLGIDKENQCCNRNRGSPCQPCNTRGKVEVKEWIL